MPFWTQRAANNAIDITVSVSLAKGTPGARLIVVTHNSGFHLGPFITDNTGRGWPYAQDPAANTAVGDTGDSVVMVYERTILSTDPAPTITFDVSGPTAQQLSMEVYEVPNLGPVDRVVVGAALFGASAFPVGPTGGLVAAGEVAIAAWTCSDLLTSAAYTGGFVEDTRQARGTVAEVVAPSTAGMASTLTPPAVMNGIGVMVVWQKAIIPIALSGTHFSPNFGVPAVFIPGPQTVPVTGMQVVANFGTVAPIPHAGGSAILLETGSHLLLEDGGYLLEETPSTAALTGLQVTVQFGTVVAVPGVATVHLAGFRIPAVFGAEVAAPGGVTGLLTGFAVPTHFGRPALLPDGAIAPDGLFVTVGFGTPVLVPGTVTAAVSGYTVPVTFGTVTSSAPVVVPLTGFAVGPQFGFPTVVGQNTIGVAGFQIVPQFGALISAGGDVSILVGGYLVPITFGVEGLGGLIRLDGIALTVGYGVPGVLAENFLRIGGLHVVARFGLARLLSGAPVELIPRRAQVYNVGQRARIVVIFEEPDGSRFDPDTVQVKIKSPSGAVTVRTYDGMTTAVVRAQPGVYYADFVPDRSGFWRARWIGDAPGVGVRRELVVAVREPRAVLVT